MSDEGQPLGPEHYELMSNAGRCDICGKPVDMSSGETLTIQEFGVDEEAAEEYGVTDEGAINAVADAMNQVAESGAGYELAAVIRENGAIRVHDSCLDETNFSMLESSETNVHSDTDSE